MLQRPSVSQKNRIYLQRKGAEAVRDRDGQCRENDCDLNYTVSYASGSKNAGTYTATVAFKGNYSGTVKKTYTIQPKGTSLSSVKAKKKKALRQSGKKQTAQTDGYEIQYSTDSKFKKGNEDQRGEQKQNHIPEHLKIKSKEKNIM